jgi:hypothetical protein
VRSMMTHRAMPVFYATVQSSALEPDQTFEVPNPTDVRLLRIAASSERCSETRIALLSGT